MRHSFATVILLLFFTSVKSQNILISFGSTYSSYDMKELKQLLQYSVKNDDLKTVISEDFPSTYNLTADLVYQIKKLQIGIKYSKLSTAGRVSYADYSGHYIMDFNCNANLIGPYLSFQLNNSKRLQFRTYAFIPHVVSKVKIENDMVLYNESVYKDSLDLKSTSISIQPGVELGFYHKFLSVKSRLGYQFDLASGSLYLVENKENRLINNNEEEVHCNWNGLRLEILIGININFSK